MYAEDVERCWRLSARGWSTVLAADVAVPHVGNAAGAQAWGSGRDRRWWAASYDLYAQRRGAAASRRWAAVNTRSEEHTSELQSLMRNSYAVFCWKKKQTIIKNQN